MLDLVLSDHGSSFIIQRLELLWGECPLITIATDSVSVIDKASSESFFCGDRDGGVFTKRRDPCLDQVWYNKHRFSSYVQIQKSKDKVIIYFIVYSFNFMLFFFLNNQATLHELIQANVTRVASASSAKAKIRVVSIHNGSPFVQQVA